MRQRVALIADTHGHLDPRIRDLAADCDAVVHAGDIGDPGVLAQLRDEGQTVIAIRGNNDIPAKWPDNARHLVMTLPWEASLSLPGGELIAIHGHRNGRVADRHANLRRRFPAARAIVYGHSHQLCCDLEDPVWVLNPGAAGRTRTRGGPSCLVLDAGPRVWKVKSYRFERGEGQKSEAPRKARK